MLQYHNFPIRIVFSIGSNISIPDLCFPTMKDINNLILWVACNKHVSLKNVIGLLHQYIGISDPPELVLWPSFYSGTHPATAVTWYASAFPPHETAAQREATGVELPTILCMSSKEVSEWPQTPIATTEFG